MPHFHRGFSPSTAAAFLCASLLCLVPAPAAAAPGASFTPLDNILLDCGATSSAALPDGRRFKTDQESASMLSAKDDLRVSVPSVSGSTSPIDRTARVFIKEATYTVPMTRPGWHWIRLRFFPVPSSVFDLHDAAFSVLTDSLVLLRNFSVGAATELTLKEFLVNVTAPTLPLRFVPSKDSMAFVSAIEVVSAPDMLIGDQGSSLFPVGDFPGLSKFAYQTAYRLNVGGPLVSPQNDTLGRTWVPDRKYLKSAALTKAVAVSPGVITYGEGESPLIAPQGVYASAVEMADARITTPNFNVTWHLDVDPSFGHLLRLHFCDIVSKSLNDLYFNVYINGRTAIAALDLSSLTSGLDVPYYKDVAVNASLMTAKMTVQIGPTNQATGTPNAILNGLEVLKMSNRVGSLDGEFGVDGSRAPAAGSRTAVVTVGFVMMFGAFAGLGAMVYKWKKRPQDWQKRNSFSSWLLPLHAGDTSFMNSKTSISKSNFYSSTNGLGRYFSFAELQDATRNFDSNAIIGVGGFGNVYIGEIDDGTKVAVKRGNPQSEQGVTEFQTEIQMLSKLRHKHLVSLIGYCDENAEMILVYEYMSRGPLRDHLYGKSLPPLSWKKRLEISIGAARGLHYLHTGAAQGIIHRDVKTTNILLDESFLAKVADFGLSKTGPTMEQTHVSTAVKGSFGYLDPEYFRRQQLTDKSDVYSFGVVLLEILCARPPINPALPREQVNLADWAMQWKRKGALDSILDPHLAGSIDPESMKKFAEAAGKCLAEYGVDRPTMGDVLWNLEYALQVQDAATQPGMNDNDGALTTPSPAVPAASSTENHPDPLPAETQSTAEGKSENDTFAQFAPFNGR